MSDFCRLAESLEDGDRTALVALADLQEEAGRDGLAAALREVYSAGKWPFLYEREWNFLVLEDTRRLSNCPPDFPSWIPSRLADRMGCDVRRDQHLIHYATAVQAVLALADAIHQTRTSGEDV